MATSCDQCSKNLTKHNEIAIHCDAGGHWFCYSCIGMSKTLFDAIKAEGDTPMLFVSCNNCNASSFPMAALKKSSALEFKTITDQIQALTVKVDSIKSIEDKVGESITMFKEQTKANKQNYADIVRSNTESRQEILNVREAVKVSVQDHYEHDERDRSIIIFKHEESKQATRDAKDQEDETFVKDLLKDGVKISAQEIQSCYRLGIFKENVIRPLKVTFAHKSGQVKVIEHLFRLANAEAHFKAVNVSIDRSDYQREELKKLLVEADQRTKASNGKRFVVRGTYKPYVTEKVAPR